MITAKMKAQALYDVALEQLRSSRWDEAREIRDASPGEDGLMDVVDYMMDRISDLFDQMVSYGHMDASDMDDEACDELWSMIDAGLD